MNFIPMTEPEESELLKSCNVERFEDLIKIIPSNFILKEKLGLGKHYSEIDIQRELVKISKLNNVNKICFMGGGIYDHFIPAAIDAICMRSEFYTAYTPYQPEVSQGTLQYLYEYQSMICELSGMDVANASLYDAPSAVAEACMLSLSVTNNNNILYSSTLDDKIIKIVKTCLYGQKFNFVKIDHLDGYTNLTNLKFDNVAAILIQSPNKFGLIEDLEKVSKKIGNSNTLFVTLADPISLGILKPPGECGADIYIAEGQILGNNMNFGGPLLGIMAVKDKYKRRIPGRIVGRTNDKNGLEAYVLTLQTREQHIRREKATSNICTNQSLLALRSTIYLSLIGKYGLVNVAKLCHDKSHYAANKIDNLKNYKLKFSKNFYKEFVIETSYSVKALTKYCDKNKILIQDLNYDDDNCFQIAVTEKRTKHEIDDLVNCLKYFNSENI